MRQRPSTVTRRDLHRHALTLLLTHLRPPQASRRCPPALLLSVVLLAAARLTSLTAAVARRAVASGVAVRRARRAARPAREELERRLNRALAAHRPRALGGTRQPLACDLTPRPYHGRPHREEREVYRGRAKGGTSHFHACATGDLVCRGRRFTPALSWVRRGERLEDVLWRLLHRARRPGVRPRYLLLGRASCTVGVIRYLQAGRYPFLMPLPLRGRPATHPGGPSGSRAFAAARTSGWASYTLPGGGRTATVGVGVKCRNYRGQWGRRGQQRLVYASWGIRPTSVEWVRQVYRGRFAIETSYRQMNQARVTTRTRDPLVRLFLVGVALVLRNVWVWLQWQVLSPPRRGGRMPRPQRLRFKGLLPWLGQVAEERLGVCDGTQAERPLSQALVA
jgi:hypothetical protein